MALRPCRECGKEVSTSAKKCPHCGVDSPGLKSKPVSAGMGCLIVFGGFLVVGMIATALSGPDGSSGTSPGAPPAPPDPVTAYRDSLELDIASWHRGGFENVMIASFRVINKGSATVRDVAVSCRLTAESGTEVSRVSHTMLQNFPGGKTTRVNDVNVGLINSQSRTAGCSITDFRF